ncbi:MAG: adenylyltransferase/cytidyltransferase family protein, partial [Bacteroidales bacterium]|nr:adenylyltransferase/cytidyltransferase family protein [Bacteroidales bacterium]
MKTALFFGSFNPIHIGHLALAQYVLNFAGVDDIWLVVSPHNPFKSPKDLAPAESRIKMATLATQGDDNIKVSDIETRL